MSAFVRHLSDPSLACLVRLRPVLDAWLERPRSAVHLRRDQAAAFYLGGRRVLALEQLDGAVQARPWVGEVGQGEGSVGAVLERAVAQLLESADSKRSGLGELELQAGMVSALGSMDSDFVVVDEQIQVPRAALQDATFAGTRVDVALLERATGDLWLIEVKPATASDLDGPVLTQLDRTRALPEALHGGSDAFLATYVDVVAQKGVLGLISGFIPGPSGRIRTACLTIGSRSEARGRIACWPDLGAFDPSLLHAHAGIDAAPARADFVPLADAHADAFSNPRAPYAPRRSRWNEFTRTEDIAQTAWREATSDPVQLGPFSESLTTYIADHHVRPHRNLDHPRSSQAACLQLFAPAVWGGEEPRRMLAAALDSATGADLHIDGVDSVAFEAPHVGCRPEDCDVAADMAKLVGEHTGNVVTGLDALIRARGRRGTRDVSVLVAVEFKYSEVEFGCCGGFVSRAFDEEGRRACVEDGPERRRRCHLLIKHRRGYLKDPSMFVKSPLDAAGSCLLLGPVNQVYRGHFTARKLAEAWGMDESVYVVVADARNPMLKLPPRPIGGESEGAPAMDAYRAALRPDLRGDVIELDAQAVVAAYAGGCGGQPWLNALRVRYRW